MYELKPLSYYEYDTKPYEEWDELNDFCYGEYDYYKHINYNNWQLINIDHLDIIQKYNALCTLETEYYMKTKNVFKEYLNDFNKESHSIAAKWEGAYLYRFIDKNGEIIYVGQTDDSLYTRMRTHFNNGHKSEECYNRVVRIEYIKLQDGRDLSYLETYFIAKWLPEYNVKDKKQGTFNFPNPILDTLEWQLFEFEEPIKHTKKEDYIEQWKNNNSLDITRYNEIKLDFIAAMLLKHPEDYKYQVKREEFIANTMYECEYEELSLEQLEDISNLLFI